MLYCFESGDDLKGRKLILLKVYHIRSHKIVISQGPGGGKEKILQKNAENITRQACIGCAWKTKVIFPLVVHRQDLNVVFQTLF
jgi:hypothetical protein